MTTQSEGALTGAVEAVLALHVPDPSGEWCDHCWPGPTRSFVPARGTAMAESAWPCATVRALRAEPAEDVAEGGLRAAIWDEALAAVTRGIKSAKEAHAERGHRQIVSALVGLELAVPETENPYRNLLAAPAPGREGLGGGGV